ncbi:hypothetical protein KNJ79_07455 [Sphingopyxis indica]|nr:hypothetical protein KNJ79_07455 [Sphingopyxis indica]
MANAIISFNPLPPKDRMTFVVCPRNARLQSQAEHILAFSD